MPIVLVRIDDRLIHGQVVEGWLKPLRANHIVVVSDAVARDRYQQILFSMAVPSAIKVSTFSIEETAAKILEGYFEKDRVMLLLSAPQDAVRLINSKVKFSSINVGGMHYSSGKRQLLRTLSVNESDISALKEIGGKGIELEGRVLPNDERVDIMDVLNDNSSKQ